MKKEIANEERYLERMAGPVKEKLMVARYVPKRAKRILDVGCADGSITLHLAQLFPDAEVLGIDLNERFVEAAQKKAEEEGVTNVRYEHVYLRDLLARSERYDAVTFVSVLHEFFSYGEGISSVLKAVADAHELLNGGGRIIVRDMVAPSYFKDMHVVDSLVGKVAAKSDLAPFLETFSKRYGPLEDLRVVNHFLLKSLYTDNWDHEMDENYLGVSLEEYKSLFTLLGMQVLHAKNYLIPFLRETWEREFGLSEKELDELVSTALLVAEKGRVDTTR